MKPIETLYAGCRFRSRLEARWAVFFDTLGIKWEYEKEGYDLGDAGWYLPDFWLPDLDSWFETKGRQKGTGPLVEAYSKAHALCRYSQKNVYVALGEIQIPVIENDGMAQEDYHFTEINRYDPNSLSRSGPFPSEPLITWMQCHDCHKVELVCCFKGYHASALSCSCHKIWLRYCEEWTQDNAEICASVKAKQGDELYALGEAKHRRGRTVYDTPGLIAAYTAARSARFEHGEQGR